MQPCKYFLRGKCTFNEECRFSHDIKILPRQKRNEEKKEEKRLPLVKGKNTLTWEPRKQPCDMRVVFDLGTVNQVCSTVISSRDVCIVPNLFSDLSNVYNQLEAEIEASNIPNLLKRWHGNEEIDGTHFILDDKRKWKEQVPTFQLIIKRLEEFFRFRIESTRLNWYKDTSEWKPFHHDAAAVKADKAAVQNFTVAVSFGATRDAAFEHAKTGTTISMPIANGVIYAFSNDTNVIWRHGILQEAQTRDLGRFSIIAWGWIDNMI